MPLFSVVRYTGTLDVLKHQTSQSKSSDTNSVEDLENFDEVTVADFLLRCAIFSIARHKIMLTIEQVFDGDVTKEALFGSSIVRI